MWFWPFLRNFNFLKIQSKFWAILSCLKGYQAAFWVSRMAWNVQLVPKNYLNWILVQLKSKYWAKLGPKLMKMVKNAENLSQFFAILSHFKGYQTIFGVCRMALVPKNVQDIIFVQCKSKYWAKMGQKLTKMVKNAENETPNLGHL